MFRGHHLRLRWDVDGGSPAAGGELDHRSKLESGDSSLSRDVATSYQQGASDRDSVSRSCFPGRLDHKVGVHRPLWRCALDALITSLPIWARVADSRPSKSNKSTAFDCCFMTSSRNQATIIDNCHTIGIFIHANTTTCRTRCGTFQRKNG
jgi:hypothetical protein